MTIKEAEVRTGLARANIRYYEDQGFFSAARGENGYRNYSDENVNTLLKVKLLRQLGFSLEEIHQLQSGEQSLGAALERREDSLERERRELDQAARLCRDIRSDGVDFYTLDARRYLDRLAREEVILEKDRDPARIFPWRRYFARTLDLELCTTLIALILQLTRRVNVVRLNQDAGSSMLLMLGALALMAGAETLLLHFWGTTPGKALLGLKILREDGTPLSLTESARRTAYAALFFGLSLVLIESGVPLFLIGGAALLIWACWQVYHEKPLFWEEDQLYLDGSTRERAFWSDNRNFLRVVGYLAAFAACIGLVTGGHLLAARPPHRGDSLTAEEFVDNYNQYVVFARGEGNPAQVLTADGTFEEVTRTDREIVISFWGDDGVVPRASFRFEPEEGPLTKVTLVRQYGGGPAAEGQSNMVSIPYDEIYVAMRSFLWSRLGDKGVTDLYEQLLEGDGNLCRVMDGVEVDSRMRFSGYDRFGDSLIAQDDAEQSYFVEFSMELTE